MQTQPSVSIEMTRGLVALNFDPMPAIGISRRMVLAVLRATPMRSIFRSVAQKPSFGIFCGGSVNTNRTPIVTARGHNRKKVWRHEVFSAKVAAMKGPIVFPSPTQDPSIP
jgi:hypothetical protein